MCCHKPPLMFSISVQQNSHKVFQSPIIKHYQGCISFHSFNFCVRMSACLLVFVGVRLCMQVALEEAKGHLMFVEAVFVCLHWQMDGVSGQRAQLGADCVSATDTADQRKQYNAYKNTVCPPFLLHKWARAEQTYFFSSHGDSSCSPQNQSSVMVTVKSAALAASSEQIIRVTGK